jgi:DNA-binding MarR family transcriptional regulator
MMVPAKSGADDLQPIADIDRVIHEPARLLILAYLHEVVNADFVFLMRETGLTRGNLSSHLSKLEAARYITVKKEFVDRKPRTMLRITERGRAAIREYRERMKQVLDGISD